MKALALAIITIAGSGSIASAQDAPPAAIVAHRAIQAQTVTHNDGRKHRQITHVRHRTIVKTPQGTMVRTTTSTTNTAPK